MTFLTPIPAIIGAAVVAPALLALYFLKLRRRPVRVGSTMLWRQAAEDLQANVPFRWLRPSVLLLAQVLALALLLLALARPAINVEGALPSEVFLLVDRSASMRATDMPDGRTRFEVGAASAASAIDRVTSSGSSAEVTIIAFGAEPEIVVGPTQSRADLKRGLDSITPADQPGDLASALRLVQALTTPDEEDEAAARPPLVLVVSDGDANAADLPPLDADVQFDRAAPETPGENLGLVALSARRDRQNPSLVRVFGRWQWTGTDERTVPVSVSLDGEVVARRALSVQAAPIGTGPSGQTPDGRAIGLTGRAESPVVFELNATEGGLLTLEADLADALSSDNRGSLVLGAPRKPGVLLVRETEREDAGTGWLLTDVLRELDVSSLTLMSASRVASLGAQAFEGVDLAIFDGIAAPFPAPVPSLHFGVPPEVPGINTRETPPGVRPIIAWERDQPLMRDISLDAVRIGRGVAFEGTTPKASDAMTELARTADGAVIARITQGEHDRVVTGFDLVQSTWPVDYSFALFLANALESLPKGDAPADGWGASTDRPVTPPGSFEDGATLTDPGGLSRSVERGGDTGSLGVLDVAGIWTLDGAPVPVNLTNADESALGAPMALDLPGGVGAQANASAGGGEPQEIWHWFLLGASALLAIEWVLFGLRAKVS